MDNPVTVALERAARPALRARIAAREFADSASGGIGGEGGAGCHGFSD
jgi:hypothetical protein